MLMKLWQLGLAKSWLGYIAFYTPHSRSCDFLTSSYFIHGHSIGLDHFLVVQVEFYIGSGKIENPHFNGICLYLKDEERAVRNGKAFQKKQLSISKFYK